jgi:hypothetical protein
MAHSVIKYITINGTLYRMAEYSYRGYAGAIHTGNSMTKVPDDEVEKIKRMVEEKGEKIEERRYRNTSIRQ